MRRRSWKTKGRRGGRTVGVWASPASSTRCKAAWVVGVTRSPAWTKWRPTHVRCGVRSAPMWRKRQTGR